MKFTYHPFSSLIAAVAVWLGLIPLTPLVDDMPRVLTHAWFILGASALTGVALALLRAPRALILLTQVVVIVAVLAWRGLTLADGDRALDALRLLTADGVDAIRAGAPPVPLDAGMLWLCLVLVAALTIVTEVLVNGLEQPAWSIAPLALPYGISALVVMQNLDWWLLAPVIFGYTAVLLNVTGAGGAAGKASRAGSYHVSRSLVGVIGAAAALVLALLVATVTPLGDKQTWGDGGPDGPIQLGDPTVRLDQDLRRPTDSPVLTYRTSNGEPAYLRTVALPSLTSSGAGLLPMTLSRSGLERAYDHREGAERVAVEVQMASVPSEYLPAPFAAAAWDAEGSWSYDPDTLSIVASGPNRIEQTVDLHYTVEATIPRPTRGQIEAADAGSGLPSVTREVPDGLSPGVATLTRDVVGDAQTAGEKALRIQQFLRSDAFDYSMEVPNSSGADAISNFLLEDRAGYCIHFAAAMIAMARMEGVDARMAVGFVPGERQDDGTFAVTSHNAHSWPELYLEGLGWVPFEPTPAYEGDPEYVDPSSILQPEEPTEPATPSPEPSAPETGDPMDQPPTAPETPEPVAPESGGGGPLGWALVTLGVLLLLALPALIRSGLRYARLREGQEPERAADAAWNEVRALFADYGLTWPDGSPGPAGREAAGELTSRGAAALEAVSSTVEKSRFARDGASVAELPTQVRALRTALSKAATPGARMMALLLPASLRRLGG